MAMVQRYFMIEPKILMDEGAGAGAGGRGGAGAGAGKRAKAEAMTGAILPALPVDLRIVPTQGLKMEGYDFIFENHDHTLGNLLQTWLVDNLISLDQKKKPTEDNPIIYFAGYNVPHPLENKMVLTIGCSSEFTARRAVVKACRGIHALFQHMALQWALVAKL
jgi:DNA-directed RNA polymerase subunit L